MNLKKTKKDSGELSARGDIISLIFRFKPVTAVHKCEGSLLAHDPLAECIIAQSVQFVKLAKCTIFDLFIGKKSYDIAERHQMSQLFGKKRDYATSHCRT